VTTPPRMRLLATAALVATATVVPSTQQLTDRQVLELLQPLIDQAKALIDTQLIPPVPPPPPEPMVIPVACGASLQAAYDDVILYENLPAPILAMVPSADCATYDLSTFVVRAKAGAGPTKRIRITTAGWIDKGTGWAGLVRPSDAPNLAAVRGTGTSGSVIHVPNGAGAGYVEFFGLSVLGCPSGNCDLMRLSVDNETDPASRAQHIAVRQVLLLGGPQGSRRGIRQEARFVDISQVWIQDIFSTNNGETQAISACRGGADTTVRFSYLQAASENIILGGCTYPHADLVPADWLIEDVLIHKPLRWKAEWNNEVSPFVSREVKNSLELKQARRVTVRRVAMVNNWDDEQSGAALLINTTTNGSCPACVGIQDALFEDIVVLNSPAGVSEQIYSWQDGSNSTGKAQRVTIRNAYFSLYGTGTFRSWQITNAIGRVDLVHDRITLRNNNSTWLAGTYGWTWAYDGITFTKLPGGPVQGVTWTNSVITGGATYGIDAPGGTRNGSGWATFVDGDRVLTGNVFGGATTTQITNYNQSVPAGAELNASADRAAMLAALPVDACGTYLTGKGADCERLAPVFAMLAYLPEP
jgi:hypothetical protein